MLAESEGAKPMAGKRRLDEQPATAARAKTRCIYATMAKAGSRYYVRPRDLPKLIALWPCELEDASEAGSLRIIAKLRRALRAERRRALSGHWSYDLNRHLGLVSAYEGELARLSRAKRGFSRSAPGAAAPGVAAE